MSLSSGPNVSVVVATNAGMNTNDAEIDHLMGWSSWDWILNTLLIFGWVLATVAVLFVAFCAFAAAGDILENVAGPAFVVTIVGALAAVVGAVAAFAGLYFTLQGYIEQVFDVLRHCTSWARSLLMTVFVAAVLVGVVFAIARRTAQSADWRVVLGVPALWIVIAVGAFLWDGAYRVAAWVPTTLGGLGAMLLVGIAVAFTMSQKDSAR